MPGQPVLVHSSPQGGTVHKFQVSGSRRFLGCYLGTCKFCENLEEATEILKSMEPS